MKRQSCSDIGWENKLIWSNELDALYAGWWVGGSYMEPRDFVLQSHQS